MRLLLSFWLAATVGSLMVMAFTPAAGRQSAGDGARSRDPIEVLEVRPNVYLLAGAGGNIVVQVGPVGVILVDAGAVQTADVVLEAVGGLTELPIRYLINTGGDADHVGGNEQLSRAGRSIMYGAAAGNFSASVLTNNGAASILAHDNFLGRMRTATEPFPWGCPSSC